MTRLLFIPLLLILAPISLRATVSLQPIFGDHMVLQRNTSVPIWGMAAPGENITVTAGSATGSSTADKDGKWIVRLSQLPVSETPIDVTVSGTNTITFHDVLVGDVWVCSGQSNMQFTLNRASTASTETPKANHPDIRLFVVKIKPALKPQDACEGTWTLCTPQSAGGFSAVGYFFGKEIEEAEKIPVGLIGSYVGATPAQAWTSLDTLNGDPDLKKAYADVTTQVITNPDAVKAAHDQWLANGGAAYEAELAKYRTDAWQAQQKGTPAPTPPQRPAAPEPIHEGDTTLPSVLFNGMIAPLMPLAIKGVIWYQGEGNVGQADLYRKIFPAMITDWRSHWKQGDFPFLYVQLPNYRPRDDQPFAGDNGLPSVRETHLLTLQSTPATGMAVTIDAGDGNNLHPPYKDIVGHRLVLAARHVAYGEDLVFSGPIYDSSKLTGSTVEVTFKDVGTGLKIGTPPVTPPGATLPPTDTLKGFAIAGSDRKFVWAKATITGPDKVAVSSDQISAPMYIRYGWASNPEVNLYNSADLPASPFRTDTTPAADAKP